MNIDTNTVNFAVDKISSAVSKALPTVTSVSKELVSYTVTNQVLNMAMAVLAMIVSILVWIPIYRSCNKKNELNEPLFVLFTVVLGFVFFSSSFCAISMATDTFMALTYPEMFTAMQMIGK